MPTPSHAPRASAHTAKYSVVVPVYGNAGTIRALVGRISELDEALSGGVEGVFVIDASPDDSGALLQDHLRSAGYPWQLVWHSRNFGSFAAIRTGLAAARGEYHGVMAADLQEPAELMQQFFAVLDLGEADVAVGVRTGRDDPAVSRFLARTYWRVYRRLVNPQVPEGGVDVFACTRQVSQVLCSFSESHSSLVGLLFWVGFRREEVPYHRVPRTDEARSSWSTRRKIAYMMDSIYSFTDLPIALMKWIGVSGLTVSVAIGAGTLAARSLGLIEVRGYTPLVLLLASIASLLLMCLGIVGSYVWRTYENSKARPNALVMWHQSSMLDIAPLEDRKPNLDEREDAERPSSSGRIRE